MKKLAIMLAVVALSVVANAASFKWTAGNIYGSDATTKWVGAVTLYAEGISDAIYVATAANGAINTTFSSDLLAGGNTYSVYFTIEDGGKTFTSAAKSVDAQATATANIAFGNMQSATQNASNWAAVPEPTSGLLMLLGVAGLALKRKRA